MAAHSVKKATYFCFIVSLLQSQVSHHPASAYGIGTVLSTDQVMLSTFLCLSKEGQLLMEMHMPLADYHYHLGCHLQIIPPELVVLLALHLADSTFTTNSIKMWTQKALRKAEI